MNPIELISTHPHDVQREDTIRKDRVDVTTKPAYAAGASGASECVGRTVAPGASELVNRRTGDTPWTRANELDALGGTNAPNWTPRRRKYRRRPVVPVTSPARSSLRERVKSRRQTRRAVQSSRSAQLVCTTAMTRRQHVQLCSRRQSREGAWMLELIAPHLPLCGSRSAGGIRHRTRQSRTTDRRAR